MLRKLTVTLTLVLTSWLVLASSAFAVVPADSLGGTAPSSGTSTSGGSGSSWLGATIGVTLAVVGIAFLVAVAVVSRNRRSALQA
jgi:hypothetical protein